ncbi:hypothetical protein [Microbacterium binotii]|uniref:WxL domain-containing protein n=1 Tax=Microbacterium binotii TaxID=462710 RepID=A0ABP6BSX1_9MICO
MKKGLLARTAVGLVGGALLIGAAGAAVADEIGDDEVDVTVDIAALPDAGALTLSVAPGSAVLTEGESADPDQRVFGGTLPTVTVTDDRDTIPAGSAWYVTGQASALTSGDASIDPGHLGWKPKLLTQSADVAEGPDVDTVLDGGPNNVGLVDAEFLAIAFDAESAAGTWQATADLLLKTPKNVTPGSYSGTITLTLWEELS